MYNYPQVYCDVEPKRMALEEANMELADAQETLENVKAKVLHWDSTKRQNELYTVSLPVPLACTRMAARAVEL